MWLSRRAIFPNAAMGNKFNISCVTEVTATGTIGPAMSQPYYAEMPDSTNWTTSFDNTALANGDFDGCGYCGSVTFKYPTAATFSTWGNTFWDDPVVERPHVRDPEDYPSAYEYFMFDGTLRCGNDTSYLTTVFTPITIARTKSSVTGYNWLAFTSEYFNHIGLWFQGLEFDATNTSNTWLTLLWGHGEVTNFTNFNPSSWYGNEATQTTGIRLRLYNASTGELLGQTDRYSTDALGYYSLSLGSPTIVFDKDINSGAPGLDLQICNNTDPATHGDLVNISSLWWSLGSDSWDPQAVGSTAVGTNLPTNIGGKRAIVNYTVASQDSNYVYGFRPGAAAQVTSPVDANGFGAMFPYNATYPASTDRP